MIMNEQSLNMHVRVTLKGLHLWYDVPVGVSSSIYYTFGLQDERMRYMNSALVSLGSALRLALLQVRRDCVQAYNSDCIIYSGTYKPHDDIGTYGIFPGA